MITTKEAARKFQFLREIASGGFGSVYLAKVVHADGFSRMVALKLLHKRWSENEEIASRMRDEARLLGWLRHRNIVEVLDLTLIDGRSAVVMEYLEAVDVRILLEHFKARADGTVVPLGVALEIGASVASALDAAYNRPPYAGEKPLRVIHRDIKPSNVMVDEHGVVKVLDFGVARADFDAREAKTAELSFGSLEYMPPERLFFEPESPASDVYSLGSTLYEMLALEKLGKAKLRQSEQDKFVGERFADLRDRRPMPSAEVGEQLQELLGSMLAFDESDRPTAADLVSRMRAFARQLSDPPIEEWAPKNVPPLIEVVRAGQDEGGTLVGRTITEDVTGLRREPSQARNAAGAPTGFGDDETTGTHTELFQTDESEGPPSAEYATGTGRDDARWSALKEATLASLSETGELSSRILPIPPDVPMRGGAMASVEEVTRSKGNVSTFEWLDETTDPDDGAPTVRIRPGAEPPPPLRPQTLGEPARGKGSDPGSSTRKTSRPPTSAPGKGSPSPASRASAAPAVEPNRNPLSDDETVNLSAKTKRLPSRPGAAERTPISRAQLLEHPEEDDEPARGSPIGLIVSIALLVVAAGVLLLAVLIIGGAGIAAFTTRAGRSASIEAPSSPEPTLAEPAPVAQPAPAPAPAVEPEPAPEPAPAAGPSPAPAPAASGAGGTVFASLMSGTKRMTVRCTAGSGQGESEVAIGEASPGECTVTAVDASRKRRTAVVPKVEARRYECFGGTEDRCE